MLTPRSSRYSQTPQKCMGWGGGYPGVKGEAIVRQVGMGTVTDVYYSPVVIKLLMNPC